ncbi:hypothetical protein TrVFT333_004564 [Trichoderma virens FT-333]|nr:hypothetical protein TrVFT333_004564 [Trichoderma virens FT-333]
MWNTSQPSMTMATTFHSFSRLPFDIRSQIWALAAYPRLIHVRTTPKPDRFEGHRFAGSDRYFASMIPQAELMHVCRESRQLAPYQKAFFTTLPGDSETRYIWVNFNEDMICLEHHHLSALDPHADDIQRLRFTVPTGREFEYWAESFTRFSRSKFTKFTALREVYLAISHDMHFWGQPLAPEEWESQKGWLVQNMDNIDEEL